MNESGSNNKVSPERRKDDQSELGLHKAAACGGCELHKADSGDAVEEEPERQ